MGLRKHNKKYLLVILTLLFISCSPDVDRLFGIAYVDGTAFHEMEKRLTPFTYPSFATIEQVNDYVNKVPYKLDSKNYNVNDYWATPTEFFKNGGDCEDYVIAKWYIIKLLKLDNGEPMHMVVVFDTQSNLPHMILTIGKKVLDSQMKDVLSFNSDKLDRYVFLGIIKTE